MKVTMYRCDHCKKMSDNRKMPDSWYGFYGKCAQGIEYKKDESWGGTRGGGKITSYHFCSEECLREGAKNIAIKTTKVNVVKKLK